MRRVSIRSGMRVVSLPGSASQPASWRRAQWPSSGIHLDVEKVAVSTWSTILSSCDVEHELENMLENPPELLRLRWNFWDCRWVHTPQVSKPKGSRRELSRPQLREFTIKSRLRTKCKLPRIAQCGCSSQRAGVEVQIVRGSLLLADAQPSSQGSNSSSNCAFLKIHTRDQKSIATYSCSTKR